MVMLANIIMNSPLKFVPRHAILRIITASAGSEAIPPSAIGLDARGLRHLIQCLAGSLAERIGQFFRKEIGAAFQMYPVG
jgi:hypothetical protein